MDKRKARRLASEMLAAAARRLYDEVKNLGLAPADRERVENAFDALGTEMEGRAGLDGTAPEVDFEQLPLFDTPEKAESHE